MSWNIPLPHYSQSGEGYCLPACVRMVLGGLGMSYPESEIARILGSRPIGTPFSRITRLSQLGLEIITKQGSVEYLVSALEAGIPVILSLRTGFLDYWEVDLRHSVVATGVEVNSKFWVHDPALQEGPIENSWNGLLAAWAEMEYRFATIKPNE